MRDDYSYPYGYELREVARPRRREPWTSSNFGKQTAVDSCTAPYGKPESKISADNFMGTIAKNIDNPKMNDADFRQFIRKMLPSIEF